MGRVQASQDGGRRKRALKEDLEKRKRSANALKGKSNSFAGRRRTALPEKGSAQTGNMVRGKGSGKVYTWRDRPTLGEGEEGAHHRSRL